MLRQRDSYGQKQYKQKFLSIKAKFGSIERNLYRIRHSNAYWLYIKSK